MVRRKGKTVALWTAVVGVAVLVAAGFAAKDRIREEYYLYQVKNSFPSSQEQANAAAKLSQLGSARIAQRLIDISEHEPYSMQINKAYHLHNHAHSPIATALAATGTAAIPSLVKALKSDDWDTRCVAAHVLAGIGPAANSAVPALIHALDPKWAVSYSAVGALGSIGTAAQDAIPAIEELLKNNSWRTDSVTDMFFDVHKVASEALERIQGDPDEASR